MHDRNGSKYSSIHLSNNMVLPGAVIAQSARTSHQSYEDVGSVPTYMYVCPEIFTCPEIFLKIPRDFYTSDIGLNGVFINYSESRRCQG